jgi:hypothetical protein
VTGASTLRRVARISAGVLLIVLALITGPVPVVQGWVFFLMGVGLLIKDLPWLRRALFRIRDLPGLRRVLRPAHARLRRVRRRLRRARRQRRERRRA